MICFQCYLSSGRFISHLMRNALVLILLIGLLACNRQVQNWQVQTDKQKQYLFSLVNQQVLLKNIKPAIITENNKIIPDSSWHVKNSQEGLIYVKPGQWEINIAFEEIVINQNTWLKLSSCLKNLSDSSVAIDYFTPLETEQINSSIPYDKFLKESYITWKYSGMIDDSINTESYSFAGFTNSEGTSAFVLGFTKLDDAVYKIKVGKGFDDIKHLSAQCDREGVLLKSGETLNISDLILGSSSSLNDLMDQYGNKVAETMNARSGEVQTGWCTWYYYYDDFTVKDVYINIQSIKNSFLVNYLNVVQVDEGWYFNEKDTKDVRGDYVENIRFPDGMKSFTDSVKLKGDLPGVWIAPFLALTKSNLYNQYPEIMLKKYDSGVSTSLDLSNPLARDHVYNTIKRLVNEYGFEYLKLDFLNAALTKGKFFDHSKTSVQNYVEVMQNVRKIAGDRYILACGAPLPPSIGIVDGMRIGFDVSTSWSAPAKDTIENPVGVHGLKPAANQTLWRLWMHNHFWSNDPDCILVRDYNSMQQGEKQKSIDGDGLTYEEARMWMELIWLSGNNAFIGENIPELLEKSPNRFELLKYSFPLNQQKCSWIDWYVNSEVVLLKSWEEKKMLGIFNLGETPATVSLPANKLDLTTWEFRERISGNVIKGNGEKINFPTVPPHGGRVWILK